MLAYDGVRVLIGANRAAEALERIAGVADAFRGIEAFGEALQTDLLHGELLLRLDRPGDAEPACARYSVPRRTTPAAGELRCGC